jgi:DNA-binding NarL/FixJ family response regulator
VIRVLICDDHAIVRSGVRALLEREPDLAIVGEAGSHGEALSQLARLSVDVVLLDLSMPNANGTNTIRHILLTSPATRVLVLSMHAAPEYVRPALRAGAMGYVVKGSGLVDLLQSVRAVAGGQRFLDAEARHAAATPTSSRFDAGADEDALDRLTPREKEVLQLVAEGCTNRQIAEALHLSPKTVDTHRTSFMRKLDLHDVQGVIRFALRRGLISPE